MSRLATVEATQAQGRVKEIYEGPLKGKHFNIFKSMANSPAALDAYLGIAGALEKASLTLAQREVIQLAVGQATGCDYCVAAHTAIGKSGGLSEAQTIGARRGSVDDPKLNALAKFALAVHEKRGHISDADLASFRGAGFTDGNVAEALAVYALAIYTNYFNHVNNTPIDFPPAPKI